MNKLDKMIFDRSKKIVLTHAEKLVEKTIAEIESKVQEETHLNIFYSGIILDVKKLKVFGLKHIQKQIKKRARNTS
jgi:hypothetical protein